MGGFEGEWVEPKTNAVIEDANWRQRIRSEIDAADGWNKEWGFLAEKPAGNTATEAELVALQEAEIAEREKDMPHESVFMTHFKKKTKGFGKPFPQEVFSRPVLTSHQYGWSGKTLEIFGRLNMNLR